MSLTRYFLSPSLSLFISLSRCLFVSLFVFFLSFLLSAFLLVRKNGREGDTGVQSPGQISSTARAFASVSGDVFAKTLCSRFSKVRCNYSSGSERRSRARESKGKKERGGDPAHSTTSERKREARIVPWTSVHETNVRGSLLKRSKTHQPPLLRDPFMSRPPPRFYLRNSYHGHSRELVISGS